MANIVWDDEPTAVEAPAQRAPSGPQIEWDDEPVSNKEAEAIEKRVTDDGRDLGDRLEDIAQGVKEEAISFGKAVVGVGEVGLQLVTGLGSAAFGTLGGAVKEAHDSLTKDDYRGGEAFMDVFTRTTEKFTWRAQTDYGKTYEHWVMIPFEKMAEQGMKAGDYVFEQTGDPAKAAAARTAVEGSIYVLPYLGAKAKRRVQAKLEEKAVKRTLAEKEVENIQWEAKQKELNAKEKVELERKVKERFDEVSAEHKGIKKPRKAERDPVSGAEILLTETDIIPFKEYVNNWKVANGLTKSKKKLDKKTMKAIESEYADYKSRMMQTVNYQYARALAEIRGDTINPASPDMSLPVGYIAHLKSKAAKETAREASLARQKERFGEYAAKERKVREEQALYEEAEARFQDQYNLQQEMAWAEKGILDAEARTQVLMDRAVQPLGTTVDQAIAGHLSSRGGIGRQRGAVSPSVYAEGLVKAGKKGFEFTEEMVREFGEQWRTMAPALYQTIAERGVATERTQAAVKKQLKNKNQVEKLAQREWLKPGGAAATIIETMGGQAITKLRRKGKNNPHLKEIVDSIEKPETTVRGEVTKPDLTAAYHMESGRLLYEINRALEPIGPKVLPGVRTLFSKLRKGTNEQLVKLLRTRDVEKLAAMKGPIAESARAIRRTLDEIKRMADEVGIHVGYLEGYFPRMYAWQKVKKYKDKFLETIEPYVRDPLIREAIYDHIIEREGLLLPEGNKQGRMGFISEKTGPTKSGNLEMERQLGFIPDHVLHPFLENDVFGVLSKYIEHSVGRIEAARRFGPNEEILYKKLGDAVAYGAKNGDPLTRLEVQRLFDLVDAHQRNWIAIKNPFMRTSSRATVAFMNMVTLPLATFTSMPEMMLPLYKGGVTAYAKAWPKTALTTAANAARTIYSGLPRTEAQIFAERLLKSSDLAATERVSAMYNGEVNAINSLTFKANFLHQWTKTMNILASETFKDMSVQFLKAQAGKGSRWWNKKEHARIEKELNRLGMDINEGIAWVKRGMPKEGDVFYDGQFRTAAVNFIHESVMTSRPSVRPMWHSIPHLAPIAHLKGFPAMFGNVVMKRWYHDTIGEFRSKNYYNGVRNTAYMMGTATAMMYIADLAFGIKDHIKYGEELPSHRKDEEPSRRFLRLADASGFLGGWSTLKSGLTAKTEWGGTSAIAMFGPTVAKSSEAIDGFGTAIWGGGTRPLARTIASTMPVGNIDKEVQKKLTDRIEENLNRVFPKKEKKRRRERSKRRERRR